MTTEHAKKQPTKKELEQAARQRLAHYAQFNQVSEQADEQAAHDDYTSEDLNSNEGAK